MYKGKCNKMTDMNQTLSKYIAQSQGNYYTYEEQQETEVPNEYIIKKHTLPQLPTEIINMILYKFGGSQNPVVKDMKEIKSKVEDNQPLKNVDLPLRNIKRFDDLWHDGYYEKDKLTQKSCDFLQLFYYNMIDGRQYDYYYYFRQPYSSRGDNYHHVILQTGEYTYEEYQERQLICIKNRTAKQLKEYLDNNGIEYKKSWKKDKLLKLCYSF
jgi:hypothetical protein